MIELPAEDRILEPEFEEVYRVGSLDGDEWEQFSRVNAVGFGQSGNLYVMDDQRSGPGIPRHVGHPFRSKWATDSEGCGPGIPRKRSCHSDMWATLGA